MKSIFRVAILDMYLGEPNQGKKGIHSIITEFCERRNLHPIVVEYDTRGSALVPGLNYDAYISTGGPGSPIDSEGSEWEKAYFDFIEQLRAHNRRNPDQPKLLFLICHSFQIFVRHYGLGKLSKRKSTSFGIFPIHKTTDGKMDRYLVQLPDPFWAVDSRDYQITEPNEVALNLMGSKILCIEKLRPHVKLERAVMCMRFDEYIFGTQFHPEANVEGMLNYLHNPEKKKFIIDTYGEDKYYDMLKSINDSDKILLTRNTVLMNFLNEAHQIKEKNSSAHVPQI
ncbi:MAG: type 1 glutamine amidotransferase [Thermaurantimonas sp.]|nr:GMP synthase [Thermaurantimonas aggregans]MCX8147919.1 GMP synthase [Thermaurantimonas aggregans]